VRARFWVESILGIAAAALSLLTLVWREWIEAIFRIDPDGGSGAAEWAAVGVLAVASIACSLLAARERRARAVGICLIAPDCPIDSSGAAAGP
jgi:hypothetical protein